MDFSGKPVEKLAVKCLSEVSWKDDGRMRLDIREAGGLKTDQYDVDWSEGNAAGIMNLLELVDGSGEQRRILVDVGWDQDYTRDVLVREGVDRLLSEGGVDMVYITHEHVDHFFGLDTVLGYHPGIKVVVPSGFTERGLARIGESRHEGELVTLPAGYMHELFPGLYSFTFDVPIFLKVKNEQVLYADLGGKGIVTITGCCHPGIKDLLDISLSRFPGKKIFGVYGGLHICPFDEWEEEHDRLIEELKNYDVQVYACNHCTGGVTVNKMREAGFNVVPGSGRHGSKSSDYPGCGDTVEF